MGRGGVRSVTARVPSHKPSFGFPVQPRCHLCSVLVDEGLCAREGGVHGGPPAWETGPLGPGGALSPLSIFEKRAPRW